MNNNSAAVARKLSDPAFMQKLLRRSFMMQSVMTVAIAALVGDRIWRDHHPPPERFFYTNGRGMPYEIVPLDAPVMSDADLLEWTVRSVVAAYTVNFKEYRDQLSRASAHFTIRGWNSFGAAFIQTGNFDQLKRARLVTTAQPERAATIRDRAVLDGVRTTKVEIPLIVTYENENQSNTQHLLVTALVVRAIETEHPDGIAIDQLDAPPA
jgi:intracellular multiplication protein IcmL